MSTVVKMIDDDRLPLWLHTTLSILVGLGCATFIWIDGLPGLLFGHLNPIRFDSGYFFGNKPLDGPPARLAGLSMLCFGLSIFFIPISQLRQIQSLRSWKYFPAVLFMASAILIDWILSRSY